MLEIFESILSVTPQSNNKLVLDPSFWISLGGECYERDVAIPSSFVSEGLSASSLTEGLPGKHFLLFLLSRPVPSPSVVAYAGPCNC